MLKLHKRGKVWHVRGTLAGRRIRCSTGTGDKSHAESIAAQIAERVHREELYGPEKEYTFAQAAVSYQLEGGERRFLEPLIKHLGKRKLAHVKPGDIRSIAKKIYPKAGSATLNRQVITPARAVVNHAHELGWCAPMRVRKFPEPKPKRKTVTQDWIRTFQTVADDYTGASMVFMFTTGARISDVVAIRPNHLELERRVIERPTSKTGERRTFYLTRELADILSRLPARKTRDGKLRVFGFQNTDGLRKAIKRTCELAGLEYIPPHQSGRHSFATEALIRKGVDAVTVARMGGWKSPRVLLDTYAHAEDLGDVADAVFGKSGTGLTQIENGSKKLTRKNLKVIK